MKVLILYLSEVFIVGLYYHVDIFLYDVIDLWKLHGFKFSWGCFKGRYRSYHF